MNAFHVNTGKVGKTARRRRGAFIGGAVLTGLMALCAFPLPVLVDEVRIKREIRELEEQKDRLDEIRSEVDNLERELPRAARTLFEGINKAFPRAESLLTLRDLLLAQAQVAGIRLKSCQLVDCRSLDIEIPANERWCTLGAVRMKLRGSASVEKLILMVGMLEATELAYTVERLIITPSLSESGTADFGLDLNVTFRTASGGILAPRPGEQDARGHG